MNSTQGCIFPIMSVVYDKNMFIYEGKYLNK